MSYYGNDEALINPAYLDAFGRQKVASPKTLFDAQLTYDLQPLLYESLTSGSGASTGHDSTIGVH
jgi:hypothetical protein